MCWPNAGTTEFRPVRAASFVEVRTTIGCADIASDVDGVVVVVVVSSACAWLRFRTVLSTAAECAADCTNTTKCIIIVFYTHTYQHVHRIYTHTHTEYIHYVRGLCACVIIGMRAKCVRDMVTTAATKRERERVAITHSCI